MWVTISHVNTQVGTPNKGSTPGLTSTTTVTKPTGLAVGDFMLALGNANKIGITGVPTGFTLLDNQDAGTNLYRNFVYWKVADANDVAASNFVWTNGDANAPIWAAISAYRGVDPQGGIHASAATVQTTTEPQTTPSVTTTIPTLVVRSRTIRCSDSGTAGDSTFTGSGNERFDSGNHSTVGYYGASYDSGSLTAPGTNSGISISHTTGTLTDGIVRSIALTPIWLNTGNYQQAVKRSNFY